MYYHPHAALSHLRSTHEPRTAAQNPSPTSTALEPSPIVMSVLKGQSMNPRVAFIHAPTMSTIHNTMSHATVFMMSSYMIASVTSPTRIFGTRTHLFIGPTVPYAPKNIAVYGSARAMKSRLIGQTILIARIGAAMGRTIGGMHDEHRLIAWALHAPAMAHTRACANDILLHTIGVVHDACPWSSTIRSVTFEDSPHLASVASRLICAGC